MRKLNPLKIMLSWLFILLTITLIALPILSLTTVGGEQQPLTLLAYMILIAIYGILVLSIITAIIYFQLV